MANTLKESFFNVNNPKEDRSLLNSLVGLILAAFAATYSRFVPSFKARFDYGAMIFILTFSLVSVGGYRVDKLVEMAQQRVSTIAIGTSICIIITVFFCPIWAGSQLHHLIERNLEKLADSLDGKGIRKPKCYERFSVSYCADYY